MTNKPWIKLLAAIILFVTASSLTTAAYAGFVTITGMRNFSDQGYYIRSTQMDHGTWVAAGDSSWADIQVPWARNPEEFEGHHIWIEHPRGVIRYVIWQSDEGDGDWVRYNVGTEWKRGGAHLFRVQGLWQNVFLIVRADGTLEMDATRGLRGRKAKRKAQ
jgi:hypothetical protein